MTNTMRLVNTAPALATDTKQEAGWGGLPDKMKDSALVMVGGVERRELLTWAVTDKSCTTGRAAHVSSGKRGGLFQNTL